MVSAGLSGSNAGDMWKAIQNGLLEGVASIGINYATQELGLNPLLANIGFSAISTALLALLQTKLGTEGNVFKEMFKTYKDNALTYLGYEKTPERNDQAFWDLAQDGSMSIFNQARYDQAWADYNWRQASYMSNVINFSDVIKTKGIQYVLDTYATSFFNAGTISAILQSGQTISQYLGSRLVQAYPNYTVLNNGKQVEEVKVYDLKGNTVAKVFFERKDLGGRYYYDLVGQEYYEDGTTYLSYGDLALDAFGKLGYTDAELMTTYANVRFRQTIDDGLQVYADVCDLSSGNPYLTVTPDSKWGYNLYNSDGGYMDAVIFDKIMNIKFSLEDNNAQSIMVDVPENDFQNEIGYVKDSAKTNLENAEAMLDSMFGDINSRFSGEEIFGSSAWEVALRSILLTSAKYQVKYNNEITDLLSSLTSEEKALFSDYARLRIDTLINPYDYYDFATADELAAWMALKSPKPPESPYGFTLTVIHGMNLPVVGGGGYDDRWADNLKDVKVKGQDFSLIVNNWNQKGTEDGIDTGLYEFEHDPAKRRQMINNVKQSIIMGYDDAKSRGNPYDAASHSFGTVLFYEAVKELKTERPDIKIRNAYLMGSPLGYFIEKGKVTYDADAFQNITNVVNIYNSRDTMNALRMGAIGSLSTNPLLRTIVNPDSLLGSQPASRELKPLFSNIKDVRTDVAHGSMWKDPKMLKIVEDSGIFTQ